MDIHYIPIGEKMEPITKFRGQYAFLSNFYTIKKTTVRGRNGIEYEGLWYPSVEHAYQAAKTLNKSVRRIVASANTPVVAKRMGKCLVLRPDWEEAKLGIMELLLRQKFSKPNLSEALLSTGDAELIEGNWWHDEYWGVCNGKGENHLGRLLMKLRKELQDGIFHI